MLDPQAQTLLRLIAERGIPAFNAQTPIEARQAYLMRKGFTQPDPPAVSRCHDHMVELNGAQIKIREFRPDGVSPTAVLPALVYYHGGGWVIGDVDTHDVLCRQICQASGCAIFSVDYRLAPEHVFPAAYDDAQAAFQWLAANAASLHVNAKRIAVGGDSAGGNLAAAVCLGARGTAHQPAFQLLIYPATLMYPDTQSYRDNGEGYALTADVMNWFMDHYLPSRDMAHDWRASPLKAKSHADLPPALVITAGFDPLRDEGRLYADALSAAGGSAEYICFERQIHGFITMGRVMREAHAGVAVCADALKRYMF